MRQSAARNPVRAFKAINSVTAPALKRQIAWNTGLSSHSGSNTDARLSHHHDKQES